MVKVMYFTGCSFPLLGKNLHYLQGATSNGLTLVSAKMVGLAQLLLLNFCHFQRNSDIFQIVL